MPSRKNLALEGLRGLASLAVAIGHFTFVFSPYLAALFRPIPGLKPRFWFEQVLALPPFSLLYSADAAVSIFFVMSGYVLTMRFFQAEAVQELQSAAAKRYVRLVVPSFVSIMIGWIMMETGAIITRQSGPIGVAGWVPSWYTEKFTFVEALFNGAIGAPLFAKAALNPPMWTIQIELIGSILLFAMMALFGTKRPLQLAGWSLFFANVLGYASPNCLYYISFFVGALLNPLVGWLRRRPVLSLVLVVLGLVGVAYNDGPLFAPLQAIALPNLLPMGPDFDSNQRLFWDTVGAILLVAGVLGSRPVDAVLSIRPLVYLGRISFSMYLTHMCLLMSVALVASRQAQKSGYSYGASALIAFAVYIPAVLLLATVFQRWVDAPSIRLSSRLVRPRAPRPAAPAVAAMEVAPRDLTINSA